MNCDCIKKVDENLAAKNAKLGVGFGIVENTLVMRLLIKTEKRDSSKRSKPVSVAATFCPFCGVKSA